MRAEYKRPWLYQKQLDAMFCAERWGLIEASTKAGKTVSAIAWLFEKAFLGKAGQNYWWVAPVSSQAEIAFRRLKQGIPKQVYTTNETRLTVTLANGTCIWFKSADKPDSLYGEDVYAAVVDEASRAKEEAWYAVRSTLTATQGALRAIGNVKGRKNWFYHLCRKAEAGADNMHYAKLTAYDAVEGGVLALSEIEDAKRSLPDHVFRELYLAEPSDDGGNPFGLGAIQKCIMPLSDGEPVCWGWDLAKSVDWTVGIALDSTGRACRIERFQKPWQQTIELIRRTSADKPALIDSTGVGDPVLEALQEGRSNFEGFKFTSNSKQQLMEGLAVAIQQQEVFYPEGAVVIELEAFEYEYSKMGVKYSAPQGMHDDCVMALALAVRKFKEPKAFFYAWTPD